jgi:hypothetical protein
MTIREEDLIALKHAHRKVDELLDNKELYETKVSYSANYGNGNDTFGFTSRPSDLSIKAAVADIRHFTAEKSPIFLPKLLNIIRNYVDDDGKKKLDDFKVHWNKAVGTKGELLGFGIELQINETPITRKLLLDTMINGDILHLDAEKAKLLAFTRGTSMNAHFVMAFIDLLILYLKLLAYLDKQFLVELIKD